MVSQSGGSSGLIAYDNSACSSMCSDDESDEGVAGLKHAKWSKELSKVKACGYFR